MPSRSASSSPTMASSGNRAAICSRRNRSAALSACGDRRAVALALDLEAVRPEPLEGDRPGLAHQVDSHDQQLAELGGCHRRRAGSRHRVGRRRWGRGVGGHGRIIARRMRARQFAPGAGVAGTRWVACRRSRTHDQTGALPMRAAILEAGADPASDLRRRRARRAPGRRGRRCGCRTAGCATAISAWSTAICPPMTPVVLGHEAAGVVDAVGPGVRLLEVGDHVVLTPCPPCGHCYWCVRDEASLCVNGQALMDVDPPGRRHPPEPRRRDSSIGVSAWPRSPSG